MSKALDGEHYCIEHQGNHSHYDTTNCTVCRLEARIAELEGKYGGAIYALRYWWDHCSGAEPSISYFEREVERALARHEGERPMTKYTYHCFARVRGARRLLDSTFDGIVEMDAPILVEGDGYDELKKWVVRGSAHHPEEVTICSLSLIHTETAQEASDFADARSAYADLLLQVQQKVDGESRHDTAKRLIRQAQESSVNAGQDKVEGRGSHGG